MTGRRHPRLMPLRREDRLPIAAMAFGLAAAFGPIVWFALSFWWSQ